MNMIDIDKFICSFLSRIEEKKKVMGGLIGYRLNEKYQLVCNLLKDQGIIYQDGSLIKIGEPKKCEGKLGEMVKDMLKGKRAVKTPGGQFLGPAIEEKTPQRHFSLDNILTTIEKEEGDAFTIKAHLVAGDFVSNDIQFYCNDIDEIARWAKRLISMIIEKKSKEIFHNDDNESSKPSIPKYKEGDYIIFEMDDIRDLCRVAEVNYDRKMYIFEDSTTVDFNEEHLLRPATEDEVKGKVGNSDNSQRMESAKAKEEGYKKPDFTELETKLKELFGITDFAAKDIGKTLMGIARKQIVEEIDEDIINEMVEDRAEHCGNPCTLYYEGSVKNYRKGILDTLEQIKKGES